MRTSAHEMSDVGDDSDEDESRSAAEPLRASAVALTVTVVMLLASLALALLVGVSVLVCYSMELVARLTGIPSINVLLSTLALIGVTTVVVVAALLAQRLDGAVQIVGRCIELLADAFVAAEKQRIETAEEHRSARAESRRVRARRRGSASEVTGAA